MSQSEMCFSCGKHIYDGIVWLMEDYRREGGSLIGPLPFHEACADQPWPLYEVTAAEAEKLCLEKLRRPDRTP